jgi:uncharacterized protein (DUF433 family)
MQWQDRITIEPGKCGGRPCIRGMCIRVADVLDLLAQLAQFSVAFMHFARVGMRGIIDLHSSTAPKRV